MADNWAAKGWMTTSISGLKELDRQLSVLPDRIAEKALRRAVAAGAGIMKREAKRRCPKRSGKLARSIRFRYKRIGRGRRRGQVFYQVGPTERYGHLVEFGTAAHTIKPRSSRRLQKWAGGNSRTKFFGLGPNGVFGRKVEHPGATAQPFLRPAFDESQGEIIKAMRRGLRRGIEREARKLAKANNAARRLARGRG